MTRCSLARERGGATAIEYSLIAALIALVLVTAATAIGVKTQQPLNTVASAMG